ncbi:hypothetical protein PAXINDRAFT_158184, partial [Paxillus involutus ATCC 200175]
ALIRFTAEDGSGTGVAFGERLLYAVETVETVDVESDDDVHDKDDGFTVVHSLTSLAFESARGLATFSEERVLELACADDVDRGIDNRVRVEASEGAGIDGLPMPTTGRLSYCYREGYIGRLV